MRSKAQSPLVITSSHHSIFLENKRSVAEEVKDMEDNDAIDDAKEGTQISSEIKRKKLKLEYLEQRCKALKTPSQVQNERDIVNGKAAIKVKEGEFSKGEEGKESLFKLEYPWIPITCKHCKLFGYTLETYESSTLIKGNKKIEGVGQDKPKQGGQTTLGDKQISNAEEVGWNLSLYTVESVLACIFTFKCPWGLNMTLRQKEVQRLLGVHKSALVGLVEIVRKGNEQAIINYMCPSWEWASCNTYLKGRILLCWDPNILKATILRTSNFVIHSFLLSLVCAYNFPVERAFLWLQSDMIIFCKCYDKAWVAVGDYNSSFSCFDKTGGRTVLNNTVETYTKWMDQIGLMDMRFRGCKYTWSNRANKKEDKILTKIDRCLVNEKMLGVQWSLVTRFFSSITNLD
ncbi:hypothetical protein GIB67_035776 [Kingdonia uniflora]|uniref:Uncharacterized protein n=1 Tax=Kingdonia uniflora TaxID=39325 RepID=A0A7J7MJE6_9MAGN|nr:hypothetical protein GIB67_035776 [Kingdonia uniflora]